MPVAAITDYNSLQTAIADYLIRDDLGTQIKMWISLAEAELQRAIRRHRQMEVRFSIQTVPGQDYYALPADLFKIRHVVLNDASGTPHPPLPYKRLQQLDRLYSTSQRGRPTNYTIFGQEMRLVPVPDVIYTVHLFYLAEIPSLASSQTGQNWLMTIAPDLYLFGRLIHANAFLIDPTQLATYKALYGVILADIQQAAFEEEWSQEGGLSPNVDTITP